MAAVFDRRRPELEQGVFETLLTVDGRPVELDAHLARLRSSLQALFPDHTPPDLGTIDVPGRGRSDGLGSLRVTVAPGEDDRLETRIAVRQVERELLFEPRPVELRCLPLRGGLGPHKWADRSPLEEAQASLPAGALPLILDGDGTVLEAARANVFAMRAGVLLTPATDGRILPGITRARALEIAAASGLETREAELCRDDLLEADEVFLTGSVRGVEQVRALDGTPLAQGGEIGPQIAVELRQTWTSGGFG
jgi:para-aminobenzoate synthetase/4-amino-4-deoxychorismate lyase